MKILILILKCFPKNLLIFTLLLVCVPFFTTCYWGNKYDAYIVMTWTIDSYSVDELLCSAVGAKSVVMEVDTSGNGIVNFREEFPCSDGEGVTDYKFTSQNGIYLRFRLIGNQNNIISESSWQFFVLDTGENYIEVDFETDRNPAGDSAIDLVWTIDNVRPSNSLCLEAEAKTVRIENDSDRDGTANYFFDFPCPDGHGRTDFSFISGKTTNIRYLLMGDNDSTILSLTDWNSTVLIRGINEVSVNFNTSRQ